ncbi:hypothetical protein FKM82_026801 [Ascaphus truei]
MDPAQQKEETLGDRSAYAELLQILSVLQWILTVVFLGPVCFLLVTWLVFSPLWSLLALYTVWLASDWKTPERGGRKSLWMSRWGIGSISRLFSQKLHKTADLDPQQNYIMGYHPHGIMSIGAFCNFGTDSTGFSRMFPGIKPHLTTLTGNFKLPLYRDYLMAADLSHHGLSLVRRSKPSSPCAISTSLASTPQRFLLSLPMNVLG